MSVIAKNEWRDFSVNYWNKQEETGILSYMILKRTILYLILVFIYQKTSVKEGNYIGKNSTE